MTDPARTTKIERNAYRASGVAQFHGTPGAVVDWRKRICDDADAADALRAQVAALQAENERLRKAYNDVVAGQEVLIQLQRREWPLMQAELAAAQAKLAVPVPAEVTQITTRLESASALLGDMGYSVAGAHMYQARALIESLARDNAALRTQAEALERERDGLHKTLNETLDEWNKADNEHHRSLAEKL